MTPGDVVVFRNRNMRSPQGQNRAQGSPAEADSRPALSHKPDPDGRRPRCLPNRFPPPKFIYPQTHQGLAPQARHTGTLILTPQPSHKNIQHACKPVDRCSPHTTVILPHSPPHTDALTRRHPNCRHPSWGTCPSPPGNWPGGQVSSWPTWGRGGGMLPGVKGQTALRSFDSEYSSAFGEGRSPRRGRGRKKLHPDPKLFSSKSMYFSIILLGI